MQIPRLKRFSIHPRQWRWFWESFWISFIVLLFITAFLYIACGRESGIQEPLVSVSVSSSQPLPVDGKGRPVNDTDVLSISFFGMKKEFSVYKLQLFSEQLQRDYARFRFLIPARYRAFGGGIYLLYRLCSG